MSAARVVALALVGLIASCTSHIAPYRPKHRTFDAGEYGAPRIARGGSLYAGGAGLFEDRAASRIGDILVIRIDERDAASRNGSTKLSKKDEASYAVPEALGLMAALQSRFPGVNPAQLFSSQSETSFAGNGAIDKKGKLEATLPVRVKKILPNGDLYVEGTKVVMVGAEEQHIYVSGLVRAEDVAADNSVPSSRVADAEIEYTGRGDVSDQQRRGWLARALAKIWPF